MQKTEGFVRIVRAAGIEPLNVWDIGSFDAAQAVELAEAFPMARVLALEADPWNLGKCTATLAAAPESVRDRIKLLNAALAPIDSPRIVSFNRSVGQNDQVGSLLLPSDPNDYRTVPVHVSGLTATDLSRSFGHPELLWMDVQGTELDFFECQAVRPKLVWMEVAYRRYYEGQPLEKDVDRFMIGIGYRPIARVLGAPDWFGDVCYSYEGK